MDIVTGKALAEFCIDKVRTPPIPYVLGCRNERGTDCINLVGWGMQALGGRNISRTTNLALQNDVECIARLNSAEGKSMLVPGALLFILNEADGRTEHAGIYVGNIPGLKTPDGKQGTVVHASASRGGVFASTLQNAWTHVWWAIGVDYTGGSTGAQAAPTSPDVSAPSPAPTAPTAPTEPGEGQAIVTASSLRLRKKPTSSGDPITSMPQGSIVDVLAERNGWVRVRYIKGNTLHEGWASGEYLRMGAAVQETEGATDEALTYDVIAGDLPLDKALVLADMARGLGATVDMRQGRG